MKAVKTKTTRVIINGATACIAGGQTRVCKSGKESGAAGESEEAFSWSGKSMLRNQNDLKTVQPILKATKESFAVHCHCSMAA